MRSFYFKLFSIVLISILGFIVYSNTFHCSFHFDDEFLLLDNVALRNIADLKGIWDFLPCRFIFYLSLALNYHFHQFDVYGYHVVNLALHLATAIMVWWLTLLTLSTPAMTIAAIEKNAIGKKSSHRSNRIAPIVKQPQEKAISGQANCIALFVGLIFVSHPIQTQAVTYIVQRAAIMATLFYVTTLCLYAKSRLLLDQKPTSSLVSVYYSGALLTAVLAMFSKEIAITLPLMILLYEFCFFKTKKNFNWKYLLPFLLTILIIPITMYLTKNIHAINSGDLRNAMQGTTKVSATEYLFTQFRVIVTYIRLIFLPVNQNLDYDYPISQSILELPTFFSLLFLAAILYLGKRLFSKYKLLSFAIFWFFLSLLPESSLFPINDVIFEHRLYLPLVGYCIFLVCGMYYLFGKKTVTTMVIALTMIIACNSVLAYQRNKVWIDEMTLLNDILQKSPNKARPHNNRGNSYMKIAKFDLALLDLNKAIELDPDYVEPRVNRGLIYDYQGKLTEALSDYNKAVEIDPHFVGAYDNRGDVYNKLGNFTQAIADYSKAIELDPAFAAAYNNRGNVYNKQGNFSQALSDFNKAIELNPKLVEAYGGRGLTYAGGGNFTQAMLDLNKAIELNPNNADSYYSRGLTNARHGDSNQAISDFTKAIELKPKNAEAYNNRGFMYVKQGNLAQALSDYNMAIESNPKLDIAYINRGVVYDKLKEFDKAWADVNKAEKLGAAVNPDFIRTLKIETGQE